jgi:NAD(P)-dependent dehydrogenase (short-subunit alcohol dehydrogenase family)
MAFTNNHTRKVVLITGASDGLGLAAAKKYAQAGFTTVLAGRSKEKLAKAVEAVKVAANIKESQADQKVYSLCFDLSDLDSVRRGAAEFLDLNLPLNILINNAGLITTTREFTKDSNVFEKTIMINMVAPLLFTELLIPRMKESGGGKILIVSSNAHNPDQAIPLSKKKVIIPSHLIANDLTN